MSLCLFIRCYVCFILLRFVSLLSVLFFIYILCYSFLSFVSRFPFTHTLLHLSIFSISHLGLWIHLCLYFHWTSHFLFHFIISLSSYFYFFRSCVLFITFLSVIFVFHYEQRGRQLAFRTVSVTNRPLGCCTDPMTFNFVAKRCIV